ncbi:SDR family NAD(P)-dependent oxidoreductase [Thermoactinospora rubra]|uniref:SDR family NAD(P)-dependent oxidoreductase n=1 Tax=Thermoactinospora rubra TaxID=1088767 RepID=UPI000A104681|nr:SDR family oxidoreductase [Thermoactinospora rubra]
MRVLVTGGSSGIGAATAVAYGRRGHDVTLTYNSGRDRAGQVVKQVEQAGGTARAVHLSLDDHETIRAAVAETGPFDALVANAVRWPSMATFTAEFEDYPAADWAASLHANVLGNVVLVQSVLPGMRARKWGRIVLISSGIAEEGTPGSGPYGTAKAALHGLARTLAWQGGKDGILTNVVAAGLTATENQPTPQEMRDAIAARTPSRRLSTAEDVAELVYFFGSAANRNVTGEIVRDGSNAARSAHVM